MATNSLSELMRSSDFVERVTCNYPASHFLTRAATPAANQHCGIRGNRILPRPKADIRISLKGRNGRTVRLNLTQLLNGKWLVYRDGARSKKLPLATATAVAEAVRNWIASQSQL